MHRNQALKALANTSVLFLLAMFACLFALIWTTDENWWRWLATAMLLGFLSAVTSQSAAKAMRAEKSKGAK